MSHDFVDRTQNLFKIDDEIRKAMIINDTALARSKVGDGLVESCLLLQEMLNSHDLGRAQMGPSAWTHFRDLKRQGNLDGFLDLERKLLSQTKLESAAVELIVGALRQAIDLMIARRGRLDSTWRDTLDALSKLVCDKATQQARDIASRPLLRRAFLAAGGSTVTMLNLLPPFPLPPTVSAGSVSLGLWLIGFATEGVLDDWVSGKEKG